jgi:hypothetical protein
MIDMVMLNNASFMSGATHHSKESISDECDSFGCCQRYGRGNRDAVAGTMMHHCLSFSSIDWP